MIINAISWVCLLLMVRTFKWKSLTRTILFFGMQLSRLLIPPPRCIARRAVFVACRFRTRFIESHKERHTYYNRITLPRVPQTITRSHCVGIYIRSARSVEFPTEPGTKLSPSDAGAGALVPLQLQRRQLCLRVVSAAARECACCAPPPATPRF